MIGKDDFEMTWKNQAEIYRSDDKLILESGKSKINFEEPQTTPTGGEIWLRTSKIPLKDSAENVIGVLGTYEDITEQKKSGEVIKNKLSEIERLNEFTVGREVKMGQLKKEIDELRKELDELKNKKS